MSPREAITRGSGGEGSGRPQWMTDRRGDQAVSTVALILSERGACSGCLTDEGHTLDCTLQD